MRAKNTFFLTILLFVLTCVSLPASRTAEDRVLGFFPGLAAQIDGNLPPGLDKTRARDLLVRWYGDGGPELIRGMKMILTGEGETNHALRLLLHLLARSTCAPGETMPLALALANNRLYALVTPPVREAILGDIVRHHALSQKIVAWQKTAFEISVDLARMPLVAQLYWADRMALPPEDIRYPIRTLADYREYVDSIETLEYFHAEAVKYRLASGDSMSAIGRNVSAWVHGRDATGNKRHLYQPDEKKSQEIVGLMPHDDTPRGNLSPFLVRYRGAECRINDFIWLNYQRRCLESFGHSVGLCEVSSLIEQAAFKGLGIPAGLMIRFPPKERPFSGHVFAMYLDPARRRWLTLEMIRGWKSSLEAELVIHKPVWHHRDGTLRDRIREKAPCTRFFQVLDFGIPNSVLEKVFFENHAQESATLFGRDVLPDNRADSDGDGLPDFEERQLGTDPARADTAGDGVSDLWKLAHGFDPHRPSGSLALPPIDGLGGGFQDRGQLVKTVVPRHAGGPNRDTPEINTISAGRFGDRVYVRFTFHNDVRKCKRLDNYIWFGNKGGAGKIPGFALLAQGNTAGQANGNPPVPGGWSGIRCFVNRDVELWIPLGYFDSATSVEIVFFTALVRGTLKLPLD